MFYKKCFKCADCKVECLSAIFKYVLTLTYINLESLIDTFLYVWLACGVDSLGKNQFLYTYNAGLPWYSGVYDQDSTWGLHPDGASLVAYDTIMQDGYLYPKNKGLKNRLYGQSRILY